MALPDDRYLAGAQVSQPDLHQAAGPVPLGPRRVVAADGRSVPGARPYRPRRRGQRVPEPAYLSGVRVERVDRVVVKALLRVGLLPHQPSAAGRTVGLVGAGMGIGLNRPQFPAGQVDLRDAGEAGPPRGYVSTRSVGGEPER